MRAVYYSLKIQIFCLHISLLFFYKQKHPCLNNRISFNLQYTKGFPFCLIVLLTQFPCINVKTNYKILMQTRCLITINRAKINITTACSRSKILQNKWKTLIFHYIWLHMKIFVVYEKKRSEWWLISRHLMLLSPIHAPSHEIPFKTNVILCWYLISLLKFYMMRRLLIQKPLEKVWKKKIVKG